MADEQIPAEGSEQWLVAELDKVNQMVNDAKPALETIAARLADATLSSWKAPPRRYSSCARR